MPDFSTKYGTNSTPLSSGCEMLSSFGIRTAVVGGGQKGPRTVKSFEKNVGQPGLTNPQETHRSPISP